MKRIIQMLIVGLMMTACTSSPLRTPDYSQIETPYIQINFSFNAEEFPRLLKILRKSYPQMAIWIRDKATGNVETLYVTHKAAKNDWSLADSRPDAIPVWYGIKPQEKRLNIDGVSGATPSGESYTVVWPVSKSFRNKTVELFIEANVSFDYNAYYNNDQDENHPGYSKFNGQPSLVWQGVFFLGERDEHIVPALIGHGDVLGRDHGIDSDMSQITSAKDLFHYIKIVYIAKQ